MVKKDQKKNNLQEMFKAVLFRSKDCKKTVFSPGGESELFQFFYPWSWLVNQEKKATLSLLIPYIEFASVEV